MNVTKKLLFVAKNIETLLYYNEAFFLRTTVLYYCTVQGVHRQQIYSDRIRKLKRHAKSRIVQLQASNKRSLDNKSTGSS